MTQRDIWADFNGVDEQGHLLTLQRFAAPGVRVDVGDTVVCSDDEGRACVAEVIRIDNDGVIELALRGAFFRIDEEAAGSRVLVT